MSEILHGKGEEELFRSLETIHLEPEVAKVFDHMRAYNEILAEEPVNAARINQIMNELDEFWHPLIDTKARFTGLAGFKDQELATNGIASLTYYEDEAVTFRGVQPVEDLQRSIGISDSEDIPRYYQLHVGFVRVLRAEGGCHLLGSFAAVVELPHYYCCRYQDVV